MIVYRREYQLTATMHLEGCNPWPAKAKSTVTMYRLQTAADSISPLCGVYRVRLLARPLPIRGARRTRVCAAPSRIHPSGGVAAQQDLAGRGALLCGSSVGQGADVPGRRRQQDWLPAVVASPTATPAVIRAPYPPGRPCGGSLRRSRFRGTRQELGATRRRVDTGDALKPSLPFIKHPRPIASREERPAQTGTSCGLQRPD
jgi:hypothetical protein